MTRFRAPLALYATLASLSLVCLMVSKISPQPEPVVIEPLGYSASLDRTWATDGAFGSSRRSGVAAWEQLDRANALGRAGRGSEAVAAWERIAFEYREADVSVADDSSPFRVFPKNLFESRESVAQAATECKAAYKWKNGDIRGAIVAYEELLDMSEESDSGHSVCCSLSDLHLLSGKTGEGLRYLRMAQDRHPFRWPCATVLLSRQLALDARVEKLELAMQNKSRVILRAAPQ